VGMAPSNRSDRGGGGASFGVTAAISLLLGGGSLVLKVRERR
jgi:hypothetical protein